MVAIPLQKGVHGPCRVGCQKPVGLNRPAVLCSLLTGLLSCLPALLSGQRHSHLHQPPGEPARLRRSAVPLALSACRADPACLGGPAPGASVRHTLASFGPRERGGWVHDLGIEGINENSPARETFNLLSFCAPRRSVAPHLSFSGLPAGSEQAERGQQPFSAGLTALVREPVWHPGPLRLPACV